MAVISEERVARFLYYYDKFYSPYAGLFFFVRNLSIFSFSVGYSEKERHVELVWEPGDRFICSIYWKIGEKVVNSEEHVARFLYHYAEFYSPYAGLLFLYESFRFSRLLWVFLKTKDIWS